MKNITEIIAPISLKAGSHSDTAQTGQGCFMNVIAYLNGEPQITDQSPCVCVTVRPIAIFANDFLKDDERNALIPYIERAMDSATIDHTEMIRRLNLVVVFSQKMAEYAAKYAAKSAAEYAEYAAKYAKSAAKSAKSAAEYAEYAAEYAEYAEYAAKYAEYAAKYAEYAAEYAASREEIKTAIFEFLDEALPKAPEFSCEIINRAEKFAKIAEYA